MRILLVVLSMFAAASLQAASWMPAELAPWQDWVLKGEEFRRCPLITGTQGEKDTDFICAWPGVLTIDADQHGARLNQTWYVEADGWVPLPGDDAYWPQQVLVNGLPAPVIDRDYPEVWLTAGVHRVEAALYWEQRPQTLRIPRMTGMLALNIDGAAVPAVQRQAERLTLGRPSDVSNIADSIDLRVFRKYRDGIPGMLTTQIHIQASGQAREEVFGPALPDGFVPLALESDEWPARLDENGLLHVLVQPGYNELTLDARSATLMDSLTARLPDAWASQEIWSYEAAPALRTTQASAAVQIDPNQAEVPDEWTKLPAWAMSDGDTLTIEQRSRGASIDMASQLVLRRDARLDFSGRSWSISDVIRGRMQTGWRFDAVAPFSLQRAEADDGAGNITPLLVTRGVEAGSRGVEWRTPAVDLRAGLRVESRSSAMLVSGWQQVFDQVTTQLHLPYGYRLIAAPGTDRGNGSWLSSWSLLDVFAAAILILLAGRLLGRSGAIAASVYLILGYHESGSPLWTILLVLALALVVRALPPGRLAGFLDKSRWVVMSLLIVLALPFAVGQLRAALYPQLENVAWVEHAVMKLGTGTHDSMEESVLMMAPSPAPAPPYKAAAREQSLDRIEVSGSRIRRKDLISQYSETTVVQTGAGEPRWKLGSRYTLNWSGPVMASQQVRLLIAPPWLVRTLRVVMVGMLGWLIWHLLRTATGRPRQRAVATSSVALLGLCILLASPMALAQDYPPDNLLQQLRERLVEAPKCAPDCASISQAQIIAQVDDIRVVLEAHAATRVALPLPAVGDGLVLRELRLDGRTHAALSQHQNAPWLALERGVHQIEIRYTARDARVSLAFALPPHRLIIDAEDWQTGGVEDGRLLTETLTLTRLRKQTDDAPLASSQQFAPYVQVTRELSLNLEWSVSSTVERLAPREGGFAVSVPTLPGEHIVTPGLQARDGRVSIAMGADDDEVDWNSSLQQASSLEWTAPTLSQHAEVWRVLVSPIWHVEFSGVPESGREHHAALDDMHEFVFHPRPGETLKLDITRPAAADGDARAIDSLSLNSEFGKRATTHTLAFELRASQGGEQTIQLPADIQLLDVTRAGVTMGARAVDGRVSLPVTPGKQNYAIRFRDLAGLGTVARTPDISLGLPAANIDLSIRLPADRWLLAATGPAVGPAVMFWGELVIMIVLMWLLSRWGKSGLRLRHWLLLGLGFSTFSWFALGIVIAWLLALEWRSRRVLRGKWRFDLVQIGLLLLTLIAIGCLFAGIRVGLLGRPDMMVSGNGSTASDLRWFADLSTDALPTARVISLPLWIYNLVMLAWALWLASATVGWLRKGFAAWTTGGYWRPLIKRKSAPAEES